MQCPCTHNSNLCFGHIFSLPPTWLVPFNLASSGDSIPECGTQHKMLVYDVSDSDVIVPHLLQLPVIRLHELAYKFEKESQPIFNKVAHHPDLHISKLSVDFCLLEPTNVQEPLSTLDKDCQMSTLKEIHLCGWWTHFVEIRRALVIGLQTQSQVCSLQ